MSERSSWEFPYPADKLHAAASTKVEFHQERLAAWEQARDDTMTKIKESGLQIDESVMEDYGKLSYSNSGRRPGVTIDDEMLRDLNESVRKIEEHKGFIADYEAWVEVLAEQGKAT